MSSEQYQQISTTTNVVEDTAYSSTSTMLWTWDISVDGYKFLVVRRLSWKLLNRWKKRNFYLPHLHLALPLGVIPSEFCTDLLHNKTRVPELLCSILYAILCLAILAELRLATHGWTHMTPNTTLAQCCMGKKWQLMLL